MATENRIPLSEALASAFSVGSGESVSFGHLFDTVGDKGFGLSLVLLALPSALPVPAVGYSTPFGLILILLGLQMLSGRHTPWLPEKARRLRINASVAERLGTMGSKLVARTEFFVRPRGRFITGRTGRRICAMLVIIMGTLMTLPIPSTNTFPAFVIFLVGVGLTEEDGLFCLFAVAVGFLAIAIYSIPIYFLVSWISEYGLVGGFERLTEQMEIWKNAIKALIGLSTNETG